MARGRWQEHGSWAVAGTFIGTIIGAGFASGQETLQFFTAFGAYAWPGLALATLLFVATAVRLLSLGRETNASSHRAVLEHMFGPRIGAVFDGLLALVLLALAASMASGAGSAMAEQFGQPRWTGSLLILGVSLLAVLGGLRSVVTAIASMVPVLIAGTVLIGVYSLSSGWPTSELGLRQGFRTGLETALRWAGDAELAAAPWWWAAAILYVAYNILLAVPVMATLGAAAPGRRTRFVGGLLGGVGLGFAAVAIHLAIAARMPQAAALDIPMLAVAQSMPRWVGLVYSFTLFIEIFTTAVAMLFGFATRLAEIRPQWFQPAALFAAVVAFVGGQLSFAEIVGKVYPAIGVMGLIVIIGLLWPRKRTGWMQRAGG